MRAFVFMLLIMVLRQDCSLAEAGAGKQFGSRGQATVEMVRISAGNFSPFVVAGGVVKKRIPAFLLDAHAVTNAEFLEFVKDNPEWRRSRVPRVFADSNYLRQWAGDLEPGDQPNSPVTNVSWFAANAYSKWKGKRLPTLDEWEYAAGALPVNAAHGALTVNAGRGEKLSRIILQWYDHPTPAVLPAVESTYKNRFGLWDMHGLVWEWVDDFNSVLPQGGNFYCGGGATGTTDKEDYAAYMRYAFRASLQASYTVSSLGFRCARDIK